MISIEGNMYTLKRNPNEEIARKTRNGLFEDQRRSLLLFSHNTLLTLIGK